MSTDSRFIAESLVRSAVTALLATIFLFFYLLLTLFLGQMNGVLGIIGQASLALMNFTVGLLGLPIGGAIVPTSLFWGGVLFVLLSIYRLSRRQPAA